MMYFKYKIFHLNTGWYAPSFRVAGISVVGKP